MDAIKKKMQAMKLEKESALDKADQLEQKLNEQKETNEKVYCFSIDISPWSDIMQIELSEPYILRSLGCSIQAFFCMKMACI